MIRLFQVSRRAPGWPLYRVLGWWTVVRGLIHFTFKLLYRYRDWGREHVPPRGPIIYVANHQSHFDPCIVGLVVGDRPFSGVARATLFHSRVLRSIMRGIGVIAIKQGAGDAGALKVALQELAAGRCVMIFPEGTRTPDGAIGEFHAGVMVLIKRSGANVVPVALEGAFDIWPIGRRLPKLTGRMAAMAGPAIPAAALLQHGPAAGLVHLKREIETMRLQLRSHLPRG